MFSIISVSKLLVSVLHRHSLGVCAKSIEIQKNSSYLNKLPVKATKSKFNVVWVKEEGFNNGRHLLLNQLNLS